MPHPLSIILGCIFLLGLAACQSSPAPRAASERRAYSEKELTLQVSQSGPSADLIVVLKNVSPLPITDGFPETMFEGVFTIFQDGIKPIELYPADYANLVIRGFPGYFPLEIPAGGSLTYRVPLRSLIPWFASHYPDNKKPILLSAYSEDFKIATPVITLQHPEGIDWNRKVSDPFPPSISGGTRNQPDKPAEPKPSIMTPAHE